MDFGSCCGQALCVISLFFAAIFQVFLVTPAGFEPATCPLGGGCSIQLSHGAFTVNYSVLSKTSCLFENA